MNILKVLKLDDAANSAFSTDHDSLTLGSQKYAFSSVSDNVLPDSFFQKLSLASSSIILTGSTGKLSSLREIFAKFVQLDLTVFVSACEIKKDVVVDLLHMSTVKTYSSSIPLERQLKKVKLSEAIVRLVSRRQSNSAYGISSCLIINLHCQGTVTSVIDVNTKSFYETFARDSILPLVEKLVFKSSPHFVMHLNHNADAATVAASLEEYSDIQNLFKRKHISATSTVKPASSAPRSQKIPGYAQPTISSRKPVMRPSKMLSGKTVGKTAISRNNPRDISRKVSRYTSKDSSKVSKDSSKILKDSSQAALNNDTRNALIKMIEELKKHTSDLKGGALHEINRELASTRSNVDQIISKFIGQGNTITELESSIADQNAKLDEWESRYVQKSSDAENAQNQLASTQALMAESNIALKDLKEKYKSIEQSYNDAMEKLQTLDQAEQSSASLRAELEALQSTNSIQEKNLGKLTSILEEKETLIVELRGLQKVNETLEAQKAKAEKEYSEHEKRHESKLKALQEKEEQHLQDIEKHKERASKLQHELEAEKSASEQQQRLIETHGAKEAKLEAKIAELNETINKSASFEYPEMDFTKINYPLTNSPTMDFTQEFGNENEGAFKKPTPLRSSSPLRMSNDMNLINRFDSVATKRIGMESNVRTSLPKPLPEDTTLH